MLLWWKAWDPEGLPPELCVRNADGEPVALDPTNPAAREELRAIVTHDARPDGLDADGLKVDFTARTPSGRALAHRRRDVGDRAAARAAAVVYAAAKEAKPDALVITHTPHPAFVDVTDMIRLNDSRRRRRPRRADEFRAEVVRAACPELPIDTDDWRVPDKRDMARVPRA